MNDAVVETENKRSFNMIWLLPILVVIIGVWVTAQHYLSQGPQVTVTFKTAKGLEAGRTKVRSLDVDVGTVESLNIDDDLDGVTVHIQMNPGTRKLLRKDSQFWVVRPRIDAEGVSGLGTLLSGAYIELQVGEDSENSVKYTGLEEEPRTPPGVAGERLSLVADAAGSVSAGSPVLYQGLRVGQVESVDLDVDKSQFLVSIFVNAPYDKLIAEGTRFWNASGLSIDASSEGIKVSTASLVALVAGGVAFDVPKGLDAKSPAPKGMKFRLFPSEKAARQEPFRFSKEYMLRFKQSVRGLSAGAPVEYRGIPIGTVQEIRQQSLAEGDGDAFAVPVLIKVEPAQFGLRDSDSSVGKLDEIIRKSVANGLYATLQMGNLISGQLYVSFDFYDDKEPQQIGSHDGYDTLPTISTGIQRLEEQLHAIMDKIDALPLQETTENLKKALASTGGAMDSIHELVASDGMKKLPERMDSTLIAVEKAVITLERTAKSYAAQSEFQTGINQTVRELEMTLRRIREFVSVLEDKPNALVFPPTQEPDPVPRASQ